VRNNCDTLDEITPLRIIKEHTNEYADRILTVVFFDKIIPQRTTKDYTDDDDLNNDKILLIVLLDELIPT